MGRTRSPSRPISHSKTVHRSIITICWVLLTFLVVGTGTVTGFLPFGIDGATEQPTVPPPIPTETVTTTQTPPPETPTTVPPTPTPTTVLPTPTTAPPTPTPTAEAPTPTTAPPTPPQPPKTPTPTTAPTPSQPRRHPPRRRRRRQRFRRHPPSRFRPSFPGTAGNERPECKDRWRRSLRSCRPVGHRGLLGLG